MHWFMIFLIGIAASIDNFAVGMSYGINGKKITWLANLFMAVVALATSLVTIIAGSFLGFTIPQFFANLMSGAIILGIGLWSFFDAFRHRSSPSKTIPQADQIDRDQNNLISYNETFWLSFALSFNAMGTAFGAGIGGLNPVGVALTVGVLSFFSIEAGQKLGLKKLKSRMGTLSEYIASLLLICIGVYTILTAI
jgi:putative sporulation protein YtaF